jgi:outer membrane protein TolC
MFCWIFLSATLASCASYQPKPLNTQSTLQDTVPHLSIDPRDMPFRELASHRFDPSDGFDMTELAMLAVANNPDLKIARDDAGIAHAQAFAAGLLPDPQLALSRDLSNTGGPGSTPAFGIGLSYDINALLLHSTSRSAAEADAQKTDLNLLWQEWQVVSQSRLLFVRLKQARKLVPILQQNRSLFADRLRRTQSALGKGLLTSDAVALSLTGLQDIQRQINDLERQINQNAHELNALLGLAPEIVVLLQDDDTLPTLDDAAILAALADLPRRRPDLLGLEAGYRGEDQRYRAALLAQFPALNIGLTRARDYSGVYSNGIGITLSLPVLNRNRGNIAIEQATRQKLVDEYQQRLNISISDIHRILDEQHISTRQLQEVDADMTKMSGVVKQTDTAFHAGNIDALAYANVHATFLGKQIEQVNLQQAILEQRVALQTLIGGELPVQNSQASDKP